MMVAHTTAKALVDAIISDINRRLVQPTKNVQADTLEMAAQYNCKIGTTIKQRVTTKLVLANIRDIYTLY